MLESISIQNYALIKNLSIDLASGLNVITGETGAGKSIIIDAISLLLGNRANKNNIRIGENKILVSGQFNITENENVLNILNNHGIELEDNQLILSREIDRNGKNICRANGLIVPLSLFKELGIELIDIHSQHEHVSLFKPENQRDLLDLYSGKNSLELKENVSSLALKLRDLAKEIKELQEIAKKASSENSIQQFQYKEITDANLNKEEEEILIQKEKELSKKENLFNESAQVSLMLSSENTDYPSLTSQLNELASQLEKLSKIDNFFASYNDQIGDIVNQFNALSYDLTSYLDRLEFDPNELDQIQSRLGLIDDLKKKYGSSVEEIISYGQSLEEKLNAINNSDNLLKEAKTNYNLVRKDYNLNAKNLTDVRLQASERLKDELESELHDLAMEKALVEIKVNTDSDLISKNGQDTVNFLISVNPGIEPRELKKVASGGEISRIMLALKGIFGEKDKIETMIFDEIDTGISGRTAQVVAEKIANLASKRQIICITHLPQIAAMADTQFQVQKVSDTDSTEVIFNVLGDQDRSEELARMLSGAQITELSLKSAQEMLSQANNLKMDLKNRRGNE